MNEQYEGNIQVIDLKYFDRPVICCGRLLLSFLRGIKLYTLIFYKLEEILIHMCYGKICFSWGLHCIFSQADPHHSSEVIVCNLCNGHGLYVVFLGLYVMFLGLYVVFLGGLVEGIMTLSYIIHARILLQDGGNHGSRCIWHNFLSGVNRRT